MISSREISHPIYRAAIYLLLLLWLGVSFFNFYRISLRNIFHYFAFSRLSSEEKHYTLESRNFYNLVLFCRENIPKNRGITFVDIIKNKLPPHSRLWLRSEYYIEKAPFYLYPRRVYRQGNKNSQEEYVVYFNPQNDAFVLACKGRVIYAIH